MQQDLYHSELEKNHRRNTVMSILDASFFQIGFVCFVPAVIIVAYLKHFTDNELVLNLPVFIANFAMALGPFIMSFYSGKIIRKKRAAVITTLLQRVFWIPVICIVYFLSNSVNRLVPAFLLAYTVFYFVWGMSIIFWQEMMGRSFLPDKFGTSMGIRESVSRIVGFAASLVVMAIMGRFAFPENFLILFITCLIAWIVSLFWMLEIKEAPYDKISSEKPAGHLKNLMLLPVRDPAFKWYVIFIIFLYGHLFVGGLYTVAGIERFKGDMGQDQLTGIISAITIFSSSVFAFSAGKISEKAGKFWGFLIFASVTVVLPISMLFCYNFYFYMFLIFLSGVTYTMWILEFTTVLGFSSPERRHEYLAFTSFIKLIPIVLYTNLGGYMADLLSPDAAFITSSLFSMAALLILVFKLRPLWEVKSSNNKSSLSI